MTTWDKADIRESMLKIKTYCRECLKCGRPIEGPIGMRFCAMCKPKLEKGFYMLRAYKTCLSDEQHEAAAEE